MKETELFCVIEVVLDLFKGYNHGQEKEKRGGKDE